MNFAALKTLQPLINHFQLIMETNQENINIEIGKETLKNLNIIRKWAMFLAIIGFIFLGLIIVIGIIAGTFLTAFSTGGTSLGIPESLMFVLFFVLVLIIYFPLHFLFRFAKHTSKAVSTLDKQDLHKAFKNLRYYFAFLGALIIIVLVVYLVALVVVGTSMAFLKGL
jgi:hypothetical protein